MTTEYRVRSRKQPSFGAYGPTKRLDLAENVQRSRTKAYPWHRPWAIEAREVSDWHEWDDLGGEA